MVGGSSLIPHVQDAVSAFFAKGKVLNFPDAEATQAAVARGAACQALSLALRGKGIIETVAADSISVRTSSGPVILVEKCTTLPYPSGEEWKQIDTLVVPESSADASLLIRVELLNSDNRVLASCPGEIKPPVKRGQRLVFRYRIDENQIFHFDLSLADSRNASVVKQSLSNPLTNSLNPNEKREEIDRIEEEIRTEGINPAEIGTSMLHLSDLYSELGQFEKALGVLQALTAALGPTGHTLNKMGIVCGQMGDVQRQEKFYLEASRRDNDSGPLFNLALAKKKQGKLENALTFIDKAIEHSKEAPYLTLKAMLLDGLGKEAEKSALLQEAFKIYDPVSTLDDWQLGWYLTAAQLAGDARKKSEAESEQRSRRGKTGAAAENGLLPELRI